MQSRHCFEQMFDGKECRDAQCRWINVVRALCEIDVFVRMKMRVFTTLVTHQLERPIADTEAAEAREIVG